MSLPARLADVGGNVMTSSVVCLRTVAVLVVTVPSGRMSASTAAAKAKELR